MTRVRFRASVNGIPKYKELLLDPDQAETYAQQGYADVLERGVDTEGMVPTKALNRRITIDDLGVRGNGSTDFDPDRGTLVVTVAGTSYEFTDAHLSYNLGQRRMYTGTIDGTQHEIVTGSPGCGCRS